MSSPRLVGVVAPQAAARRGLAPGDELVRRQMERIIASPDCDASRRCQQLLRFIVEEALAGRGDDLTPSAIATRVFGRGDDFDPVADPIVGIQAGCLRRSLKRYYRRGGKHDPVRIDLPRGSCVPAFRQQAEAPAITDPPLEPGFQPTGHS